jgi:hypothetical protein
VIKYSLWLAKTRSYCRLKNLQNLLCYTNINHIVTSVNYSRFFFFRRLNIKYIFKKRKKIKINIGSGQTTQFGQMALQKLQQIATCSLTRVQCRTRVKHLDTCSLTRVLRVSNVHVTNCTI